MNRRNRMTNEGYFISFEGPEGAGKTTVVSAVAKRLEADGKKVLLTREPGGIRIAEKIRSVILDKESIEMDAKTEALLYAAARRQHLVEKVIPAIEKGMIVLCDRFIDSSLAYQGHARGLGMDEVLTINEFAIGETMPDLTIFFDVKPEIGLSRILHNKEREQNRLDLESLRFHQDVYEGYQMLVNRYPERIISTDASLSQVKVVENVYKIVSSRFMY